MCRTTYPLNHVGGHSYTEEIFNFKIHQMPPSYTVVDDGFEKNILKTNSKWIDKTLFFSNKWLFKLLKVREIQNFSKNFFF